MSLVPPSHREGLKNKADSYEQLGQRVIVRRDTPDGWLKNDPVLEAGEFGYEIGYPTGKVKIGTGSTRWSELPYLMARGPAGTPGPAGPAGAPGKGIQIKGVADVWPPPGTPEIGDLWVLDDPIPATAPAGSSPGDGFSWTGTKWVATGPIQGPEGPAGADGTAVSVFSGTTTPTAKNVGDMWLKPTPDGTVLSIWDGIQWVVAASGGTAGDVTVDTSATGPVTGVTASSNLPLQQWSEEMSLKAAFKDTPVTFTRVRLQDLSGGGGASDPIGGDGWVLADYGYFGNLQYGNQPGRAAGEGYVLPTPTEEGYLRADQDPATGWYFAEPVLVSDTEPPAPAGGGAIWIDPTGTAPPDPNLPFSNTNPPAYLSTAITQQPNGLPIGLSADGLEIHQPLMVGGVPVLVNGKKYLLPLIPAPPSATASPLFVFEDSITTQQLDGTFIGEDPTGMFITQPYMVGGVPVVVNGTKYLLPLIEV
jgi:hypothetical protein